MRRASLGELASFVGGGTPSRKLPEYWGGPIPWATVKDLKKPVLDTTVESISEEGLRISAANLIPKGSIVVPTRMALGKVAVTAVDMAINQDLKALRILEPSKVNRDYLARYLESRASYLESRGKGATVKGITLDVLRELPVPLPPLAEQKRIAAILDKADAIRRKRQQAIDLTDQLLRSAFHDQFGKTDSSWAPCAFKEVALPKKNSFVNGPFGSNLLTSELFDAGVPVIYIQDIRSGRYLRKSYRHVTEMKAKQLHACSVHKGDVLIAKVGDPPGSAALYSRNEPAIVTQDVVRIRPNRRLVEPEFLVAFLNSEIGRKWLKPIIVEATRSRFGLGELKKRKVLIPPLSAQQRFAKSFRALESRRAEYLIESLVCDQLVGSLTQNAFRGDLAQRAQEEVA